jgi:hypothetical protein
MFLFPFLLESWASSRVMHGKVDETVIPVFRRLILIFLWHLNRWERTPRPAQPGGLGTKNVYLERRETFYTRQTGLCVINRL